MWVWIKHMDMVEGLTPGSDMLFFISRIKGFNPGLVLLFGLLAGRHQQKHVSPVPAVSLLTLKSNLHFNSESGISWVYMSSL